MEQQTIFIRDTAPVIIYKTKTECSSLVPVKLSADKTRLLAFPAPADLKAGNHWLKPVKLNNGYWLDQQGIGPQTGFLKLTYEAYYELNHIADPALLLDQLAVDSPFEEFYYCGKQNNFEDLVEELNIVIDQNKLHQFHQIIVCKPRNEE